MRAEKLCSMFGYSFPSLFMLFQLTWAVNGVQKSSKFLIPNKRDGMGLGNSIESKFSINPNTIILTAESRSMGAQYINETELSTNQECLLWCWENPNCNVAVFEEMTHRNCFLFDCGSPADFRCKFTNHNFYTSSIMKTTQHSYDLKQWGKEAKHRNEVAPEKEISSTVTSSVPAVHTPPAVAVLNTPASTIPSLAQSNSKFKTEHKCRHYQFQCLNNSECIAIYNVCDGIPQCPDGSDESSDLHCPTKGGEMEKPSPSTANSVPTPSHLEKHVDIPAPIPHPPPTPPPPPVHVYSNPPPALIQHAKLPHKEIVSPQRNANINHQIVANLDVSQKQPWQGDGYGSNQAVDYDRGVEGASSGHSPFSHKHSQFVAANDPRAQYPNKWPPEEYERYQQPAVNLDQQYIPYENGYQRGNEGYPKNPYPDYDKPIYDTYHQEDNPFWVDQDRLRGNGYVSNDYAPSNIPSPNRKVPYPSREEMYASHQIPMKNEAVGHYSQIDKSVNNHPHAVHELHRQKIAEPENIPIARSEKQRLLPYSSYEDLPRTEYRAYPEVRPQNIEIPQQRILPNMYDNDEAIRESLAKQLQSPPVVAPHMYEPVVEVPIHTTPVLPSINFPKQSINSTQSNGSLKTEVTTQRVGHSKTHKSKNSHSEPKQEALVLGKMTEVELAQSTYIHRQERNNAVLALVLGLVVTALLIVLVSCRLKTLRRRSRKGRPLAHDADYLVNGLYL